jgi:hypothetical protein
MEDAMPLIYLPLIMYASWMEFMAQPFRASVAATDRDANLVADPARRPTPQK